MRKMKLDIQKFASGSFEFDNWTSGSAIRGKIEWSSTVVGSTASEKSNNNKSSVTARIYVMRTGSSSNPTYGRQWHGEVDINGNEHYYDETYNGEKIYVSNSWVLINTFTDTVPHNTDGTKSCYIWGEVYGPTGTSLGGKSSWGGQTVTLDTIPRMSPITSVTSGTTDYTPVLTWTPLNNEFTYKIEYSYGNWSSGQSALISPASTNEQTYNGFTILGSEVAPYITDRETAEFTATLYTYASDGTTLIGSTTKTFKVTLNASYVPTASIGTITDAGGLVPASWGILVANKSKLAYDITGTPSLGSTISSYTSIVEGNTYSGSSVETNFVTESGSVSAYVTDSRGRNSAIVSKNYTVYPYSSPVITLATAERCLQDGTLSATGTYVKYSFSASISSCNGNNTATYQLGYREHNTGSYTTMSINNGATDVIIPGATFNAATSYDIQFLVTDYFTSTPVVVTLIVNEGFRLVHYNKNKRALALGKMSTATGSTKLLEVALPMAFTDDAITSILDIIYPIGSIYMSVNNISPQSFLGGTWELITDRFLIGAGNNYVVNSTGGNETIDVSHNHGLTNAYAEIGFSGGKLFQNRIWKGKTKNQRGSLNHENVTSSDDTSTSLGGTTDNAGSTTLDIRPPYLGVYMWKRIR